MAILYSPDLREAGEHERKKRRLERTIHGFGFNKIPPQGVLSATFASENNY